MECHAGLADLSISCPPLKGRLPMHYSPVCHSTCPPKRAFAFDLHVLGTPPAFTLSQDQTLQFDFIVFNLVLFRSHQVRTTYLTPFELAWTLTLLRFQRPWFPPPEENVSIVRRIFWRTLVSILWFFNLSTPKTNFFKKKKRLIGLEGNLLMHYAS